MISDKKECIKKYLTEFYNNYFRLLTSENGNNFPKESLTGKENAAIAFKFILGHLMGRGRKDEVSSSYTTFYLTVLQIDKGLSINSINNKIVIIEEVLKTANERKEVRKKQKREGTENSKSKEPLFSDEEFAKKFGMDNVKYNGDSHNLNPNDIEMIHDLLTFQMSLFNSGKDNMFDFLITESIEKNIAEAYKHLIKIRYVGDKLASYTLRDLIFLSDKNQQIKIEPYDYFLLFPVDTWVKKGGKKLLQWDRDKDIEPTLLKSELITLCDKYGFIEHDVLAPLKLNAGIWYDLRTEKKESQ